MKLILILILLVTPILPTLWAIRDIAHKSFRSQKTKVLWGMFVVFLPVIGGITYIVFGRRQATKVDAVQG